MTTIEDFFSFPCNKEKNAEGKYMKPKLFISHITEEKDLAKILKDDIERRFMGAIEVFVSSDGKSIAAGSEWFDTIKQGLNNSDLMLVLCSTNSVTRPWIPFELGAAWMKGINPIPICHTDMLPEQLPSPISMLQGINLSDNERFKDLVDILHERTGLKIPEESLYDFKALNEAVCRFEREYGVNAKANKALANILKSLPYLKELFQEGNMYKTLICRLPEYDFKQLKAEFDVLVLLDMLSYPEIQNNNIFIGTTGLTAGSEVQVSFILKEN
ncbi:toll/interleukin-1 receptor domain-containing protein, partial [Enterococcus gallinarum]|uniref:toll/interleukin-1 receptor domain-containing protein n=1 Tax=Enterococcus gallinarum TaxID=1353 RepID=UPI002953F789